MTGSESPVGSGQDQGTPSPTEGKGWAAGERQLCPLLPALGDLLAET